MTSENCFFVARVPFPRDPRFFYITELVRLPRLKRYRGIVAEIPSGELRRGNARIKKVPPLTSGGMIRTPPSDPMPSLMADSQTVSSVCESIDSLCKQISNLDAEACLILPDADESQIINLLQVMTFYLQKIEAIFEVHHDLLDREGKMSKLFALTEAQDSIEGLMDSVEISVLIRTPA